MIYAVADFVARTGPAAYVHACRIGEELGGDFVKTAQPDQETLRACRDAITIPLIVAGGADGDFAGVRHRVEEAMAVGARGAAIGRTVFHRPDPRRATAELLTAVHR